MSARELFSRVGVSERLYTDAFEPMLLVGLFAPGDVLCFIFAICPVELAHSGILMPELLSSLWLAGEQCSAAAALGMLKFFLLNHQADFDMKWPRGVRHPEPSHHTSSHDCCWGQRTLTLLLVHLRQGQGPSGVL